MTEDDGAFISLSLDRLDIADTASARTSGAEANLVVADVEKIAEAMKTRAEIWADYHTELMSRVAAHGPVEIKSKTSLTGAAGIIKRRANLRPRSSR